jgi:DNA polymerase III epsilon subunit-like protein
MSKSKKIYQYTLEGKLVKPWNSISDAAKVMGCNESTIRRAANGQRRQACNFYWRCDIDVKQPTTITYSTTEISIVEHKGPKILLLDIETLPLLALVFQKQVWKAKISHDKTLSDWYMVTWAAKWLNSKEIMSDRLTSEEISNEDDSRIVKGLWELLDEADCVIAHNALGFDIPNINTRSIKYNLFPPSPFKIIDTLRVVQSQFGFTHNSLDALAGFFGLEGKTPTTFELWKDCMFGKEEALASMEVYNIQDVIVLEEVYLKLRPYIKSHSNLDLHYDDATPHCPTCGSTKLSLVPDKSFYTQAVKYQLYRCECGALSRAKQADKFEFKKKISAIPR